jgi:hypothetical protein
MPQVTKTDGYTVYVYTRDEHPPAHVHVERAGTSMKFLISPGDVEYHSYKGRKPRSSELVRAGQIIADHLFECLAAWKAYNERS